MAVDWFTPLYLLAIYGMVRFFRRPKQIMSAVVPWSPLESVAVTLAIYFGAQLVGGTAVFLLPIAKGLSQKQALDWIDNNIIGQFVLILVIELLTLWLLNKFLNRRKADFKTIGLRRRPEWRDLGQALLGFLIYFLLFAIIASFIKTLSPGLNVDQKQQIGFSNPASWQLPFVFASLVILPPVVEELLVRGFLYTGLRNGLPKIWAFIIASGLFGVAHLQAGIGEPLLWIAGIDTFILSMVLIHLREKTGSLWASICLHMLKNGVAFLSLFIFHIV